MISFPVHPGALHGVYHMQRGQLLWELTVVILAAHFQWEQSTDPLCLTLCNTSHLHDVISVGELPYNLDISGGLFLALHFGSCSSVVYEFPKTIYNVGGDSFQYCQIPA